MGWFRRKLNAIRAGDEKNRAWQQHVRDTVGEGVQGTLAGADAAAGAAEDLRRKAPREGGTSPGDDY